MKVHFIGIGGIGMSSLAQLSLGKGFSVSGSDLRDSEQVRRLREMGIEITIGHNRESVRGKDLVVYSSAVKPDNVEFKEAKKKKIPLLKRAEFLSSLLKDYNLVSITGAHGKTTTSSLTAHMFIEAGLSPTVCVGGIVGNISNNARLGAGKYFVLEADESDGTFLLYKPAYSIITNIDKEHLDFFKTFDNVKESFRKFIFENCGNGVVIWCFDDVHLRSLMQGASLDNISFGLDKRADVYASGIKLDVFSSEFDVYCKNKFIDRFRLSVCGMHNVSNVLSVIALGLRLGIDIEIIKKALNTFLGVKRRFQVKYDQKGILVIDDYAHHPTEISKVMDMASRFNGRRLLAVLQPHRYSRMQYLLEGYGNSFGRADQVFITDIYAAGEKRIKGVSSRNLCKMMQRLSKPKTSFVAKKVLVGRILDVVKEGDLLLFLGAGDITRICDELVEKLQGKN